MSNRFFVIVVVFLWLIAMSWLFVAKILPPFGQGLPPSYLGLSTDTQSCWRISLNEEPIGWAASRVVAGTDRTKEIHARLLIEQVRFANLAPEWKKQIEALHLDLGPMDMDARSRIELDPHGSLAAIEAKVKLSVLPIEFSLRGRVEQSELKLRFQSGSFSQTMERAVPDNARLGVDLSPDAKLPGMYVGRRWQMEVVNPLPMGEQTQLIEAEVVCEEIIQFSGKLVSTRRLEYRRTNLVGADDKEAVQAILWVAEDGTVLRQQAVVLGSKLRFERMVDPEAQVKAKELIGPLIRYRSDVTMDE